MSIPLQPGIQAPDFLLPAANLGRKISMAGLRGKNVVLLFFPSPCTEGLADQLARYQERVESFAVQAAEVIGVSDGAEDGLRKLAGERGIGFALVSDSDPTRNIARLYGVVSENGAILPSLFVIDDEGLIRRVYEPGPDAGLPNPAI